jgi:hypothetical protein
MWSTKKMMIRKRMKKGKRKGNRKLSLRKTPKTSAARYQ